MDDSERRARALALVYEHAANRPQTFRNIQSAASLRQVSKNLASRMNTRALDDAKKWTKNARVLAEKARLSNTPNPARELLKSIVENRHGELQWYLTRKINPTILIDFACLYGQPRTLQILVDHGADPRKTPQALLIAAKHIGSHDTRCALLRILLTHGADPINAPVDPLTGMTVLMYHVAQIGILHNGGAEIAAVTSLLIQRGAAVNARDSRQQTALMHTAMINTPRIVIKALVDGLARLDLRDDAGRTALLYACISRLPSTVHYLLERGAKVNQRDNRKRTALMESAYYGDIDSLKFLLDRGANVNQRDDRKRTALMEATYNGDVVCVKVLLEHNADKTIRNDLNETVLDIARRLPSPEIYELLV